MKAPTQAYDWRGIPFALVFVCALLLIFATSKQQAAPSVVTLTEFSDFQCPYCKQAASVVEQLRHEYGNRVKFVFKQMPLSMHKQAFKAAQASVCASEQGKFWEYHDRLFAGSDLSIGALNGIASEVALNNGEFSQCLDSQASRAKVEKDMTEAARLGVSGTPTFFIGGKALKGAATFVALKQEIDNAIGKLHHPVLGSPSRSFKRENPEADSLIPPARVAPEGNSKAINTPALKAEEGSAASGATLSINDVSLDEDSCQNKSFVFTVTLSKLAARVVTVNFATSDGRPDQTGTAAVANEDYVPVSGTLTFTHMRPNGPNGSYLVTISVPLGNHVASTGTDDQRAFTVTLSGATNATIIKSQAVGTLLDAATSCLPAQNAGCFINFCGARTTCTNVNRSATAKPIKGRGLAYCDLAGTNGTPDPNFAACNFAGLWLDSDGDGLSDAAEAQGYLDVNGNGVYDPGIDVPLPGANPNTPDVYVHYDYVAAADHDHNPPPQAIQYIVDAFAAHGANLHIDPQHYAIDESTAKVVTQDSLTSGAPDYLPIPQCSGPSAKSTHQLRQAYLGNLGLAYHYIVFSHWSSCDSALDCTRCKPDPECGGGTPPFFGSLGSAEIVGDDAIVSLGPFRDLGIPLPLETWAGVTMHELGHNFGLLHGGPDCDNYKPNYLSVMNYSFDTTGIPVGAAPGDNVPKSCATDADCTSPAHCSGPDGLVPNTCFRIDYSGTKLADLNEFSPSPGIGGLDETKGLSASPTSTDISVFTTTGINLIYVPTNGAPIDWNQDGIIETHVTQDINNDFGATTLLTGSNDWATSNGLFTNLNFDFQCTYNFANEAPPLAAKRGVSLARFPAGGALQRIAAAEQDFGWLIQAASHARPGPCLLPVNPGRRRKSS